MSTTAERKRDDARRWAHQVAAAMDAYGFYGSAAYHLDRAARLTGAPRGETDARASTGEG